MQFWAFEELERFSTLRVSSSEITNQIVNILPEYKTSHQFKPDLIRQYRSILGK